MRNFLVAWGLFLLPAVSLACDVCGIYLGVQPHDRRSSVSALWRFRQLEGDLTSSTKMARPKHGGHGVDGIPLTGLDHYEELYQVLEVRADLWLADRVSMLASVPVVNNYRAVNGYIVADVYGLGDPFLIARYLVANTKCLTENERTVHRLLIGGGAKMPLGRNDRVYQDVPVAVDLQPGTGTWDLLGSAEYMVRRGSNGASVAILGRLNGTNADGYRLGNGLSTTAEVFRRWDIGEDTKIMPSLGLYHELSGRDEEDDVTVLGTGSSTLFTNTAIRVWWRNWSLTTALQYAVAWQTGALMVPNRMRVVSGITYNLIKN
jgi:hypothetical protein